MHIYHSRFLLIALVVNIFFIGGCAMNNKITVLDLIGRLDSLDVITISTIESDLGCKLLPIENKSILGDLLDLDQNIVPSDTQGYFSERSAIFSEVDSVEVTEIKKSAASRVEFVEILFKEEGMLAVDQVKSVFGSDYKLGLNRPSFPVGDRCYAEFITKKSKLIFGFYNCEKMDAIIKVRILKN